jgi:hypothetical protein
VVPPSSSRGGERFKSVGCPITVVIRNFNHCIWAKQTTIGFVKPRLRAVIRNNAVVVVVYPMLCRHNYLLSCLYFLLHLELKIQFEFSFSFIDSKNNKINRAWGLVVEEQLASLFLPLFVKLVNSIAMSQ